MTQTTSRFFDEIATLVTGAAGAAQGLGAEMEAAIRSHVDAVLRTFDVVSREEFEVVRDMARKAREENVTLQERVSALESAFASASISDDGVITADGAVADDDGAGQSR